MTALRFQVVRGGRLLDIAGHKADFSDILIEGDVIREIGGAGMTVPDDAREIDAGRRLIMPGLVNAHTHGHGSLGRGMGDRWTLELLLNAGPWLSGGRIHSDKYLAAQLNAADMITKGCTACYDLYFELPLPTTEGMDAVARAYADTGVRAVVAPMMADKLFFEAVPGLMDVLPDGLRKRVDQFKAAPYEESLAAARGMIHGWTQDRSQVRPALAPTIPLHCSDDFITACRDLAADEDVGLHMHLAESKVQAVSGMTRYGKTLTAHLDDLGLLGPHFTGAHSVWLDGDDILRMADNGASVAHNPGSNLRLGSGIAPVQNMLEAGVNVGIGTDGSNCSDNQNMFDATRFASFVSRVRSPNYETWLSTDEVLTAATQGSARTLGMGDAIGQIKPGYKADMVFLDLDNINFVPFNDPTNQIVHSEDSSAVSSVMVGGRMVFHERRFTTFDHGKLMADAEAAVERLRGATAEARELATALEDHVGHYCVGLARQPYHIQHGLGW